jgi:hypothetical protein
VRLVLLIALACACEPDLDGTAFKCDMDHSCPSDLRCINSRCRRIEPVDIACGDETCGPTEQCCADLINGNRCILASQVCPDDTALCDGKNDCSTDPEERCCNGDDTTACALNCPSDEVACTTDDDCPSDAIHCCPQVLIPWGKCSNLDCSRF